MNLHNLQWKIAVLLLLLQTMYSLPSRCLPVHGIPIPNIENVPLSKGSFSFPIQQSALINSNRQRCGFTSDLISTTSLRIMIPGRKRARINNLEEAVSSTLSCFIQATSLMIGSLTAVMRKSVRKYWWCFPMILALIPPYFFIFKESYASMPDWWSVVRMDHLATSENAKWIIASFLGSNIAYGMSGTYLIKRFQFFEMSRNGGLEFRPTKFSVLGVWVLVAGLISTIFHSVQALGSYTLAEALCYLDHAVACSAVLYFFDTCGIPSKMTSLIGAVSIVTLISTTPSYALLHSSWHYLSAATATLWALDGFKKRSDFHSKVVEGDM